MLDPKDRFSDRAVNYRKHRPGYPGQLIDFLIEKCPLNSESRIADVGSGTGIFSKLLLDKGLRVFSVEPNKAMRREAENDLRGYDRFASVNAAAEQLPFEDSSIDLITAAQAMHWFDRERCKPEFKRVLKKEGHLALIWNDRLRDTPFLVGFENLLKSNLSEYRKVDHKNITNDVITDFFSPYEYQTVSFPFIQIFDYEGLKGRALSSSYSPKADDESGAAYFTALRKLFDDYNIEGKVEFRYKSTLYFGRFSG